MTYYWRAKNVPELRGLKPEDRGRWWREARVASWARRDWLVSVGVVVAGSLVGDPLSDRLHVDALIRNAVVIPMVCVLAMGVMWIYDALSMQPRTRRWLQVNLVRQMARDKKLGAI